MNTYLNKNFVPVTLLWIALTQRGVAVCGVVAVYSTDELQVELENSSHIYWCLRLQDLRGLEYYPLFQ